MTWFHLPRNDDDTSRDREHGSWDNAPRFCSTRAMANGSIDPFMGQLDPDTGIDLSLFNPPDYMISTPSNGGTWELDDFLSTLTHLLCESSDDEGLVTVPTTIGEDDPWRWAWTDIEHWAVASVGGEASGGGAVDSQVPSDTDAFPTDGSDVGWWHPEDFFDWAAASLPTPIHTPQPDEATLEQVPAEPAAPTIATDGEDRLRILAETSLSGIPEMELPFDEDTKALLTWAIIYPGWPEEA